MDENKIKERLGARIKILRRQKGITLEELAKSIGGHKQVIQRIESGKINPTIYTLREIVGGLNITLEELLKES